MHAFSNHIVPGDSTSMLGKVELEHTLTDPPITSTNTEILPCINYLNCDVTASVSMYIYSSIYQYVSSFVIMKNNNYQLLSEKSGEVQPPLASPLPTPMVE